MDLLSKWDTDDENALAPLGALQKDSFLELASLSSYRPMPIAVPLDEPVNVAHKVSVSGNVVPGSAADVLAKGFAKLGIAREKVETAQQFYSWFSRIEEEMERMEAERYVEYLETLKSYHGFCQHVTEDLKKALLSLDKLESECVSVTTKTNALHDACEHLLADQTALINTAENLEKNLEYFLEYDNVMKYLTSSNVSVTGENFLSTLSKIDSCIDFMNSHSAYMESANYLEKYKGCLLQALGMIKAYAVKSLESTTQSVLNRKTDAKSEDGNYVAMPIADDAFTLYYGKFRANAPKIKSLMEEIENRVRKGVDYQRFLSDIHHCYFQQRETLLGPSVTSAMSDLAAQHKQDHCALFRSSCAFMVHVCEDEHQLFGHFFSVYSPKLHDMLLRLCGSLYDVLRPMIVHVYHLETLAELCMILKTEMIDDHVLNNPEQLHAFHQVALQMLEDVQERLVYRANVYVRDDIRGYRPSPGDLAYPEKLQMMERIAKEVKEAAEARADASDFTEVQLNDERNYADGFRSGNMAQAKEAASPPNKFNTSPADMHGMWFPTVRRVLLCLSKLYRCIDKTIFQGLSQEALQACVESLAAASQAIAKRVPDLNKKSAPGDARATTNGQLFLIKHLLILREQITPFQAEFVIRETQLDFSRTKDAAYRFVLEPRSIPNLLRASSENSLVQLMCDGTPEVKEFYIDSKKDVDRQLKTICEEFIQHQTGAFCGDVTDFISKATKFLQMTVEEGVTASKSLRQQPYATPELLHNLVGQVYRGLKLEVKKTAASLALYLANRETEHILFKPIKLNIQHVFQQLDNLLAEHYTEEDRAIVAAPTPDQVGLLITTIMKQ